MSGKKHSELSASGSERWIACPGSVMLSRLAPQSPESPAATEGTLAHTYLEKWLTDIIKRPNVNWPSLAPLELINNDNMFRALELAIKNV